MHEAPTGRWLVSLTIFAELFAYYSIGPVSIPDIVLFTVVGLTFGHVTIRGKLKTAELEVGVAIIAIIALTVLNWPTATLPERHAEVLPSFFGVLATVGVLTYWTTNLRTLRAARRTLITFAILAIGGAFMQGVFGYQVIPNPKVDPSRLGKLGINLNIPSSTGFIRSHETLGAYINTACFLMMMGFFREGRRVFGASRVTATLGPLSALSGILLVQSRSTLFSLVLGLAVFVVLSLYWKKGRARLVVFITSIPVASGFGYLIYSNWSDIIGVNLEGVIARLNVASTALRLIDSQPWWGYGFFANQEIFGHDIILHNTLLMIAVGIGVPGLMLYLFVFVIAAHSGIRCINYGDWRAPIAIALLSSLAASFAEINNYNGILNTAVYTILGLLITLKNVKNIDTQNKH